MEPLFRFEERNETTSTTSKQELQGTLFNVLPVVVLPVSPNNNECDVPCDSEDKDVTIQEVITSATRKSTALQNGDSRASNASRSALTSDSFLSNNSQLSFLDANNA